jgi:hypothetical protein
MNLADAKARVARSNESVPDPMVELPLIFLDTQAPHAIGWAVWRIGVDGPAVAAPDLTPLGPVPEAFVRKYMERLVATARGACHRCSAVAGVVGADPETTRAAWAVLEVSVGLVHAPNSCPLIFTEADRQWLDERAFEDGRP